MPTSQIVMEKEAGIKCHEYQRLDALLISLGHDLTTSAWLS